jgi:nucleotide-binding universal stress UspA family protein
MGTDHKEALDRKAQKILNYYKKELEDGGLISVRTLIREGIPGDEITKVAEEENVDLIIVGSNGKKGFMRLLTGCVSKDVEKNATVPVFVAKGDTTEKAFETKEVTAAV